MKRWQWDQAYTLYLYRKTLNSSILNQLSQFVIFISAPFFVCVFLFFTAFLFWTGNLVYAVHFLLSCGIAFAIITFIRKTLNFPRPFEVIAEIQNKSGHHKGESFPSRHTGSAFVISMMVFFAHPLPGTVLLLFSCVTALCRVLRGIHFLLDVIVGAFLSIAVSCLYYFTLTVH